MGASISTVITSVAGITFDTGSSFTVKDSSGIIDEVEARDCPVFMLAPDWMTSPELVMDNLGSGTAAQWTFTYELNYRFFYRPVGMGRNKLADVLPGLIDEVVYFIDGITANDNIDGCEHIQLSGGLIPGIVEDPAGNAFFGMDIGLEVLELIN